MPNRYQTVWVGLFPCHQGLCCSVIHATVSTRAPHAGLGYLTATKWAYAFGFVSRFTIWQSRNAGVIIAGTE
ncbi:hypothetical protein [Arthrobacter sp. zg-Y1110]|uniref:hypothetical protein n=1 Tax=Arthrobacter sp. zg-Y1110 TaxID=2886932 RepID=UPI001D134B4B|nr:hypothetical protein [Arthrobacter sp. zg-Y1110]MCC3290367.1 hypothetical protein [Arthrobacter sp. zg-Y1110]UWX84259.1 hypothetical protein N2K99_12305 [Arthrobacter sp. zg-Y1110]